MVRIVTAAMCVAFAGIFFGMILGTAASAQAQTATSVVRTAHASQPIATEMSAQRRRALRRLPIYPRYQADPDGVYPRYNPGPNAVRDCTATYVQEYRPSGTVIVPRMNCFWRRG
jgi:hypothetical protein